MDALFYKFQKSASSDMNRDYSGIESYAVLSAAFIA